MLGVLAGSLVLLAIGAAMYSEPVARVEATLVALIAPMAIALASLRWARAQRLTATRAAMSVGGLGAATATAALAAMMVGSEPSSVSAWLNPIAGALLAGGLAVQVWATRLGLQSFLFLGLAVNLVIATYAPLGWLASDPVSSVLRILAVAILFGGAVALAITYVIASRTPPIGDRATER